MHDHVMRKLKSRRHMSQIVARTPVVFNMSQCAYMW